MSANDREINYEEWWRIYSQVMNSNKTLAIHIGHFDKGIRTHKDSVINKNRFIEKLLDMENFKKKEVKILDAGCGVGGTIIYFAKKYPHANFIGINISPGEIFLAKKFAQLNKVSTNTEFIVGDYQELGLINDYFDGIFTIQSIVHAKDIKKLLQELSRVLKSDKKLVIDDFFLTKKPSNFFMKKAYNIYCKIFNYQYLDTIEVFKNYLTDAGFVNIKTQDITKNSRLSFFIIGLKWFIYFISFDNMKKNEKRADSKNISKRYGFSINLFIYSVFKIFISLTFLLNRTLRMMQVTAVKKKS